MLSLVHEKHVVERSTITPDVASPPARPASMRSSFARVRRYLPRLDAGLWLVYICGFLSAVLWPPLVILGGMLTELLVTAGNVKQAGTGLGLLNRTFPGLESN